MGMKINLVGYLLILFVLLISLKIYYESDAFNLKCIISGVDGNKYCVRERSKLTLAADKLATITKNLKLLVAKVKKDYPDRTNVKRLAEGFNPQKVSETLPTSEFTAFSENKGEKLAFCLNTEKKGGKLIDENTLMFVAIHEISHIATESVGHTNEFWTNFKFLLEEAAKMNIYKPIDYKKEPQKYCGMTITDNPFFDF
jgi:hypothetical protein